MTEQLAGYLQSKGYQMMVTNVPGLVFLFHQEMQSVNVIILMEMTDGIILPEQYCHIREQMQEAFERRGAGELHAMGLLITNEPEASASLCEDERFFWMIDSRSMRLMIYEHQAEDFYGLRGMLEEFLAAWQRDGAAVWQQDGAAWTDAEQQGEPESVERRRSLRESLRTIPFAAVLLVVVNCVVFLIYTWRGEVLYNEGELLGLAVVERGEYYRMITSMFMHADSGHLFGNMLMLYAVGAILEMRFGRIRFLLLYLLSGIGAAAASVWHQLQIGSVVGSIGASGAVYGLIGALFFLVVAGKGRFASVTLPRILLCIGYSLYSGLTAERIDNAAHIGGLICGFVLAALLFTKKSQNPEKSRNPEKSQNPE